MRKSLGTAALWGHPQNTRNLKQKNFQSKLEDLSYPKSRGFEPVTDLRTGQIGHGLRPRVFGDSAQLFLVTTQY